MNNSITLGSTGHQDTIPGFNNTAENIENI